MSDATLRAKLIRLAHSNAELRPHILPLVSDRKAAVMDDRKVQALFDSWGDYVAGVFDDNSVRGNPAKRKRGFRLVEKLRAQYAAGTPLDKIQAEWNRYKRSISENAARSRQPDGEDGLGWDLFASKAAARVSDRKAGWTKGVFDRQEIDSAMAPVATAVLTAKSRLQQMLAENENMSRMYGMAGMEYREEQAAARESRKMLMDAMRRLDAI